METVLKKALSAEIIEQGLIDTFPEGLTDTKGNPVHAETSCVMYANGELFIASDKDVPGYSAAFVVPYPIPENCSVLKDGRYLKAEPFLKAKKFEDFAVTADGSHFIAVTGFDRHDPEKPHKDMYNVLMAWPSGEEENVQVIAPTENKGFISSSALRPQISRELANEKYPNGAPYFKIEGLTGSNDERLLFGIREYGLDYDNFDYAIKILAAPYKIDKNGRFELTDTIRTVYDFDASGVEGIRQPIAVSSIEYDADKDRYFILTSFEHGDDASQVGGYLWLISREDFEAGKAPELLRNESGEIMEFTNKPEGVALITSTELFVICDDDRVLGEEGKDNFRVRKPHQAAYMVVKVSE